MSYPPQPGNQYGQYSGNHEQYGYPQSGGFPQQGGQYGYPGPQSGGYAPPGQYDWQPYGQPGGIGGPTQQQNKNGLWLGISLGGGGVAVLAVVVFLVTGLLAPGFLREDTSTASAGTASTSEKKQPEADYSAPQAMNEFLKRVNSGDTSGAISLLCESSGDAKDVRENSGKNARLTGKLEGDKTGGYVSGDLGGTVDGKSLGGGIISLRQSTESGYCVDMFSVYVY